MSKPSPEKRWLLMQDLRSKGYSYRVIGAVMEPQLSESQVSRIFIKHGIRAHPGATHKCFVCDERFFARDWNQHYESSLHQLNEEAFIEGLDRYTKGRT